MLSSTFSRIAQSPWARLVWAGIAVLALLQVVAFYQLCASQVQRANARETVAVEQRNALTDCLDYRNKSTISSCSRPSVVTRDGGRQSASLESRDLPRTRAAKGLVSSAVPVSYVIQ